MTALLALATSSVAQSDSASAMVLQKYLLKINSYLSEFKTLETRFLQSAGPRAGISRGTMYIERPGKARWDYVDPTPIQAIVNNGKLIYYDKELDQITYARVDDHPIAILLKDKVNLITDARVLDAYESGGMLHVMIAAKGDEARDDLDISGTLTLVFSKDPFELRRVIRRDDHSQLISLQFIDPEFNKELDDELFQFKNPKYNKPYPTSR